MFCSKCGSNIPDDAKTCPNCGADLSASEKFKSAASDVFNTAEKQMGEAFDDVRQSFNGSDNQTNNGNPNGGQYSGGRLQTDRGLGTYILLSIITCGIYSYYFLYKMAHDVNIACEGDGEKTSGLVAFILLSFITCGIYAWIWYYSLGNRLASNAPKYGMTFQENGTTILLWLVLGSWLCFIGQFVAMNILIKNTNKICAAYNQSHGL